MSGVCEVRTSQPRVAMIPSSPVGTQPASTALIVELMTGIAAARPTAMHGTPTQSACAARAANLDASRLGSLGHAVAEPAAARLCRSAGHGSAVPPATGICACGDARYA